LPGAKLIGAEVEVLDREWIEEVFRISSHSREKLKRA
jgi:hypothetical protein